MIFIILGVIFGLPILGVLFYYLIFGRLRFVPANHRVVVTSGEHHRVLSPGYNILSPFERPIVCNWSFDEEQRDGSTKTVVRRTDEILVNQQKMDIEECEVLTSDKVILKINGIVYYKITDVYTALTTTENATDFLAQIAFKATQDTVIQYDQQHVYDDKTHIETEICQRINDEVGKHGMLCTRYIATDLKLDSRFQDHLKAKAEAEAELGRQQLLHEAELVKHARARDIEEDNHKTEMVKRARARDLAKDHHETEMQAREHRRMQLEYDIASERYVAEQRAEIARISIEADLIRQRRENEEQSEHVARLVRAGLSPSDVLNFFNAVPLAQAIASGIGNCRSFICDNRTFKRMFLPLDAAVLDSVDDEHKNQ